MNRLDLIEIVVNKTGLSKKEADAALRVAFDEICERLTAGEIVKLTDFGTFDVKHILFSEIKSRQYIFKVNCVRAEIFLVLESLCL